MMAPQKTRTIYYAAVKGPLKHFNGLVVSSDCTDYEVSLEAKYRDMFLSDWDNPVYFNFRGKSVSEDPELQVIYYCKTQKQFNQFFEKHNKTDFKVARSVTKPKSKPTSYKPECFKELVEFCEKHNLMEY